VKDVLFATGTLASPKMGLEEEEMGWHSFKRFRKTWLRGRRCLEGINTFWLAHKPQSMSELYSHLHEELVQSMKLQRKLRKGFSIGFPLNHKITEQNSAPGESPEKSQFVVESADAVCPPASNDFPIDTLYVSSYHSYRNSIGDLAWALNPPPSCKALWICSS
jgi:hypothetical protein